MELLAPAGNLESALAAFDGGADAVYCGLGRFNARERAANFTPVELGKLLKFAHENGRRVYLTLNTLVKEDELGAMFEALCDLAKLRPDALIVQDPGVIGTVRRYFPELPLHASTQMGIHNSPGVAAMAALGMRRVILERQMTLAEIRQVAAASPIELEVFIHGSLCCSLSGRCLLSSALGAMSGNRGKCKQPCRRAYTDETGETAFRLSPRDLCGIDLIEPLREIGIASLKIEGRLRSPDYIWKTSRAYRLLIDHPHDGASRAEAEKLLSSAAGRGSSAGFYDFAGKNTLIDAGRFGAFGKVVAQVDKCFASGLAVTALAPFHLGDRLRLVPPGGGEGESFSLIRMESRPGETQLRARAKDHLFLPGRFTAGKDWKLCKIGENGFDYSRRAAALPEYRFGLHVTLVCSARCWEGKIAEFPGFVWQAETAFSPAQKRPLCEADCRTAWSEGVPEPWCVGDFSCRIDGAFFVPGSEIKKLRRAFWEAAAPQLDPESYFSDLPRKMEQFCIECGRAGRAEEFELPDNRFVIPAFLPEAEVAAMRKKLRDAYERGVRDFEAAHWHALALLKELPGDIRIIGAFPLPVANSRAAALLQSLGVCACEAEPELETEARLTMAKHSGIPLFAGQGALPLLVTRLPLVPGVWNDGRAGKFRVRKQGNLSFLFAEPDESRDHFAEQVWK